MHLIQLSICPCQLQSGLTNQNVGLKRSQLTKHGKAMKDLSKNLNRLGAVLLVLCISTWATWSVALLIKSLTGPN